MRYSKIKSIFMRFSKKSIIMRFSKKKENPEIFKKRETHFLENLKF